MSYLDNSTITVDAVLTARGREILSRGQNQFEVVKFALGDDEVDYTLWNTNHPSGSQFYGYAIENMPVLEAPIDGTKALRYKLLTLTGNVTAVPVVKSGLGSNNVSITIPRNRTYSRLISDNQTAASNAGNISPAAGVAISFSPTTLNYNSSQLYKVTVASVNRGYVVETSNGETTNNDRLTVLGGNFRFVPPSNLASGTTVSTSIIVEGTETGGSETISVTITQE